MKVPIKMPTKIMLSNKPLKTFRSPWILRALISLNSCIRTNVLKMMVKWTEGPEVSEAPIPLSVIPNSPGLKRRRKTTISYEKIGFWGVFALYLINGMSKDVFGHFSADKRRVPTIRLNGYISHCQFFQTFRRRRSSVGGSVASARDANVSMIRLTQSIWTALSGGS